MVFVSSVRNFMKISPAVKELRIHLCQSGKSSDGVRQFITSRYVNLKQENPELPILVRECSGVTPKLWVRYEEGEEKCVNLKDMNEGDVANTLESLASSSATERVRARGRN